MRKLCAALPIGCRIPAWLAIRIVSINIEVAFLDGWLRRSVHFRCAPFNVSTPFISAVCAAASKFAICVWIRPSNGHAVHMAAVGFVSDSQAACSSCAAASVKSDEQVVVDSQQAVQVGATGSWDESVPELCMCHAGGFVPEPICRSLILLCGQVQPWTLHSCLLHAQYLVDQNVPLLHPPILTKHALMDTHLCISGLLRRCLRRQQWGPGQAAPKKGLCFAGRALKREGCGCSCRIGILARAVQDQVCRVIAGPLSVLHKA